MNRQQLIAIASEKVKLVRTENDYTQEKMAEILGISKKTLVQIEKGRIDAGWTTTVALFALFRESSILQSTIGGDPMEVIELTAHDFILRPKDKTMGGYIWWRNVHEENGYRLQQNVLSQHFRIIDAENFRLYSTLDENTVLEKWTKLTGDTKEC